jgi:hypothetical protein
METSSYELPGNKDDEAVFGIAIAAEADIDAVTFEVYTHSQMTKFPIPMPSF